VRSPDRPPRPGRGVLWRALLAAVLTISLSATAVASAVLLEVEDVVHEFNAEGRTVFKAKEVDRAEAGDPRTFLILGTDERYADRQAKIKPRSFGLAHHQVMVGCVGVPTRVTLPEAEFPTCPSMLRPKHHGEPSFAIRQVVEAPVPSPSEAALTPTGNDAGMVTGAV